MTRQDRKRNRSSDSNSSQPESVNKNQGDRVAESVLTPRTLRKRINRQKEDEITTKGDSIPDKKDKVDKSGSLTSDETVQELPKNQSTPRTLRKRPSRQSGHEKTKEEAIIFIEDVDEVEKSSPITKTEKINEDIDKSCHVTTAETIHIEGDNSCSDTIPEPINEGAVNSCSNTNAESAIERKKRIVDEDSMDVYENITKDAEFVERLHNQPDVELEERLNNQQDEVEDKDDHSIENISPSIQSDPVLQQSLTEPSQDGPTDFSGQLFNKENNIPNFLHRKPAEVLHASLHDEDALAAARLMTDMAASNYKTIPHPNIAETHVTNSGYGYCNSGDHGSFMSEYSRQNSGLPGNLPNQATPGMWHPSIFGQPQDPYKTYDNQWDENYQNVGMYDTNNNIMNQGHSLFQSSNNSHFGNMNMPVRMMGNNTTQFENLGGQSYPRMQQPEYRQIHNLPQGMPIDYSMQIPQNPMMLMGPNTNMPFRELENTNPKRQVRKIVLLDPKHGKRNLEPDEESPVKRRKRSRNSQVSQESITNYDEIVKNLFVPAPPTKTVLIQPKFLNKEREARPNDIDPTQVRSISHRGLIRKYIDYLLMENEYITEISKAVSLPMENCVMDDPYLMDVIRIKIPFPTPKYMQFLKDFYPAIQVDWKALNHQLEQYRSGGDGAERFHTYYLDNRAVPVLLGEAFYFFQRESDRKTVEKSSS